jgi:TM2 domain-containing membrane protein YozV
MLEFVIAVRASSNCSEVFAWQYACDEPELSDGNWSRDHCFPDNYWLQPCEVFPTVLCVGERNFTRRQWCPNHRGKHYGTAVLLSFFGGVLGLDRFYLGYHSFALVKLFTGGLFFFGYMLDFVLITLQILGPSDGSKYSAARPFPFLMLHAHRDVV